MQFCAGRSNNFSNFAVDVTIVGESIMRKSVLGFVPPLILALILPSPAHAERRRDWHNDHRHDDHSSGAGLAVGLAIVGIAAAVAASNAKKRERERDSQDRYYWEGSYSPARDIQCFRQERRCYRGGQISYEWTDQQFGYDPYRRGY
jgi:hypothetical protein